MKRYDDIILNKLIDSYENSAYYRKPGVNGSDETDPDNEAGRSRGIFCRIDKRSFPEYYDETSRAYEILHEQLRSLETKGLIHLFWKGGKPGHILEKVSLEKEKAEQCYDYLKRKPKYIKEQNLLKVCKKYRNKDSFCEREESLYVFTGLLDWVTEKLQNGESTRQYADPDDPEGFDRICSFLYALLTNNRDIYLRQLSVELYNDSKAAEKEIGKTAAIIKRFADDRAYFSELNSDEILEEYGVYRNPVWLYLKGYASLKIRAEEGSGKVSSDQTVIPDLSIFNNGLGLTPQDLIRVEWGREWSPECILTVENLTSFHQQNIRPEGKKALVIYIGGYAGRTERKLLERLKRSFPDIEYLHSGDIDCGGFKIWRALCEQTGIAFRTYKMDIDTFEKHREYGRALTAEDRKELKKMAEEPFYTEQTELFRLMLDSNIKLEQECFVEE